MEHGILMTGWSVKRILEGRKTQTRRVVKWKPREPDLNLNFTGLALEYYCTDIPESGYVLQSRDGNGVWNDRTWPIHCPYGKRGSRLWVREAWRPVGPWEGRNRIAAPPGVETVQYRADGLYATCVPPEGPYILRDTDCENKWRPSIHMPRWASRITLEIVEIRVERVQQIRLCDVAAEGVPANNEAG